MSSKPKQAASRSNKGYLQMSTVRDNQRKPWQMPLWWHESPGWPGSSLPILRASSPVNLLTGQQAALRAILRAYKNGEHSFYLSGMPGTGKTFLTGAVVEALYRMNLRVAVAASTNAAVLQARSQARESGWASAVKFWGTAHRLLGLVYDPIEETVIRKGENRAASYDAIIVDEASVLGSDIVEMLLLNAKFVLFVGDRFQLKPVNDDKIEAFTGNGVTLDEIIRQSDGDLITLVWSLMRNVRDKKDFDLSLVEQWSTPDLTAWQSSLAGNNGEIVIAYTNAEVARLNRIIRRNRGADDEYVVGDRVIFTRPWYITKPRRKLVFPTNSAGAVMEATRTTQGGWPIWNLRVKTEFHEGYIPVLDTGDPGWIAWLKKTEPQDKQPRTANIAYGYAITAHRSEGSEWWSVNVQARNFGRCWDKDTQNRLLYTAVTRTRGKLSVLI